jgi:hypothetical protein
MAEREWRMIANMEQQYDRWQGNPVPLDSRGTTGTTALSTYCGF